jgi:hypothetical protein
MPARAAGRLRACWLGLALVTSASPARAQLFGNPLLQSELPSDYDRGRNVSVLDRPRPEYEAPGVISGPVTLRPRLRAATGFTSNVNGNDDFRRADAFVTVSPELTASTAALIDDVTLSAGGDFVRYLDTPGRNQSGYFAAASARQRVGRSLGLFGSAAVRRYYEQNIATGTPADAAEPVPVQLAVANLRAERTAARWQFTAMGEVRSLNYGDVRTLDGGRVDQDNRDRREWLGAARASYAWTPEMSLFAEGAATRIDYAKPLFAGFDNRDATQFRLLGGVNLDIGALVRGRFGLGYVHRDFSSARYDDFGGLVADARLQFFPSTLTNVTLSLRRLAGESAIVTAPGYFGNGVRLEVDHELNRNLLLNASIDYEADRYRQSSRRDDAAVASAGARYFVSPMLGLGVQASYLRRRSRGEAALPALGDARLLLSMVVQK